MLFRSEKVKAGQFLGVFPRSYVIDSRNIRERSSGMKRVSEGDYCMIRRECHFYSL